ncbi:PREDICTED: interferon gamma-like [Gekko japonicus]|uniref:Interferon gamma-like n=1 Tax=Gekko japonicus TaxID=146911 RepID=A0ABM1JI99_GEKJA|nr:PREDICTED: interferon gamma-like [Gekko japonicus]
MTWQICLFVFLAISCSDGQILTDSVFDQIKEDIIRLEQDYNASQSDVAVGKPVFTNKLHDTLWSEGKEKRILLAQIISMYWKMLKNSTNIGTAKHIRNLVNALELYKTKYNESLRKATDIIELSKLPLTDLKLQRKAVVELYPVLQEVNKEEIQRKRRSKKPNPQRLQRLRPYHRG